MSDPVAEYVRAFERYADEFVDAAETGRDLVLLKREHTLRVLENGREIADSLHPDAVTQRICLLGALLHDTGRFPQFREYGTFDDRRSANHGYLGVRALKRWGVLAPEDARVRHAVLAVVGLHNRKLVAPGLPEEIDCALRVVRDADKVDIMPVIAEQLERDPAAEGDEARRDGVVLLHLERDRTRYSRPMLDAVLQGRTGDYTAMRYASDFALLLCSWAFDLNYPASRRLVRERGHMERVLALLPDDDAMRDVAQRVRVALAE